MVRSSGTRAPTLMYSSNFLPRAEPLFRSARIRSPVEICGTASWPTSSFACVPLPAPAGPNSTRSIAVPPNVSGRPPTADARTARAGEALVVPRDEVRLDLLDGVQRDADHDHDRGAAEEERHVEAR